VAEYELAWRPQGYGYTVQIDGVPDAESGAIRTRAVFYCDVETQDVVVLRYGFLDEAAMVSLPLKNKNYTRSKIVLGETIVDMYMPIHDTLDSYLIWMDENTDVYFYIKAHVSQENLLRMAQSVRQVKIPQAQS